MRYAIWLHLYNLKNVKNTHGGVLTLLHGCFSRFLNCTNATKSRNASHMLCQPPLQKPPNFTSPMILSLIIYLAQRRIQNPDKHLKCDAFIENS